MPENVTARREQQVIPTYIPKEPNAMPMFFEKKPYQGASGRLYPLPVAIRVSTRWCMEPLVSEQTVL